MPTPELLSRIRQMVLQNRLEAAFEELAPALEKERNNFPKAYRNLIAIRSEWKSLVDGKQAGVLSSDQQMLAENRIRNRFLTLLDGIEKGPEKVLGTRPRALPWIGAGVLVAAALAVWFLVKPQDAARDADGNVCPPAASESTFPILLHPFQSLKQQELGVLPHRAILARLDQLRQKYQINTTPLEITTSIDPFLSSSAQQIAGRCKARLVIWGSYEQLAGETYMVNTQFQFFNPSQKIDMTKAEWDPLNDQLDRGRAGTTLSTYGSVVDTLANLTSIIKGEDLTRSIEQTLLYLFGIIAHQSDHPEVAIDALSQTTTSLDSANQLLRTMSLADSYFQVDDIDKSLKTYDEVLAIHPDYPLAVNNRAYLNLAKGNLKQAIQDLSKKIAANPRDTKAIKARWEAYLKDDQIEKAEQDLRLLNQVAPDDPDLKTLRERTRIGEKVLDPNRRREE